MSIIFFFVFLFFFLFVPVYSFSRLLQLFRKRRGEAPSSSAIQTAIEQKKLSAKSYLLLVYGSLGLGFVAWYFFNSSQIGLQVPAFFALFGLFIIATADSFKTRVTRSTLALIVIGVAILSLVAIRASGSLTALNIFAGITCLEIALLSLTGIRIEKMTISDYFESLFAPVLSIPGLGGLIAASKKLFGKKTPHKITANKEVIIGVVVAVPLLVLFTILFATADSTFSSLLPNLDISSWNISSALIGQIVTVALVGLFISSLLFYTFVLSAKSVKTATDEKARKTKHFSKTSALIVLVSVVGLFALFSLLQIPIIFGSDVLADGANLSENARKGFGQLVFASMVVFGLLAVNEQYVPKKDVDTRFKALSLSLIFLTFVVLASAFKRLLATEAEFGFTVTRLFGHSFMILLGLWLALLAVKMVQNLSWSHFSQMVALSCIGYVFIMNAINPDLMIARTNINRAEIREIDARYLSTLSSDAWPAIEDALEEDVFTTIQLDTINYRFCRSSHYTQRSESEDGWRSWNKSRSAYFDATATLPRTPNVHGCKFQELL